MVSVARILRKPVGHVSNAAAKQALHATRDVIEAEVRKRTMRGQRVGLDVDDLRSIAEGAVLEAWATWKPSGGRNRRTWAGQHVRWRLREALANAEPAPVLMVPDEPAEDDPLGSFTRFEAADEVADRAARARTLDRAIAALNPRRQRIVRAYREGRTFEDIGRELDVGHQYVAREYGKAVDQMRTWWEGLEHAA